MAKLNQYVIGIYGNQNRTAIDNFHYALTFMSDYKAKYEKEFRFPKGTRYNWFPLVLLHKYRNSQNELDGSDKAGVHIFMRKCMSDPIYKSFYYDGCEREGNALLIHYRAPKNMSREIEIMLKIYGLNLDYEKEGA